MSAPGSGAPGSFAPAAASGLATVLGTLAITEANDTLAAAGTTLVRGALAVTEANDTLVAAGGVIAVDAGTLAVTEANDTLVAAGTVSVRGSDASTEANDTLVATGTVLSTLLEGDDTLVATGVVTAALLVGAAPTAPDRLATYGRRVPLIEQEPPRQIVNGTMRVRACECCDEMKVNVSRGTILKIPRGGSLSREVREAFEAEEKLIRDYFEALGFEVVD